MPAGPCPVEAEPSDLSWCDRAPVFLQSGFWGSFKARFGWEARPFTIRRDGNGEIPLMVLARPLAPGLSFAYVPWGPAGWPGDEGSRALAAVAGALRPHLRRDTGFIRFDPPWYGEEGGPPAPVPGPPLVRAGADIQAPDTVVLDLGPPPELILAAMKAKCRYNIGLAARKGVAVRWFGAGGEDAAGAAGPAGGSSQAAGPAEFLGAETEQALALFYALLRETAARDGIAIHSFDYYRGLFAHAAGYRPAARRAPAAVPHVRLYLAEYQGRPLAGIVTLFRGPEAVYLYGASSNLHRNLMAPYALQWAAIRDAREWGCASYDFFGVPPSDDPAHPMAGLYRFKTGFIGASTGRIIHRPGSWDYPYRPLRAGLFNVAEKLRKRLRNLKKNRPPVSGLILEIYMVFRVV